MVFFIYQDGTTERADSGRIFQGSNNATTVYAVAPFEPPVGLQAVFTLPDGTTTAAYVMEFTKGYKDLDGVNLWSLKLPRNVTLQEGEVGVSFNAVLPDGNLTTFTAVFNVEYSGIPEPPTATESEFEEIYNLLTQYYNLLSGTVQDHTADIDILQRQTTANSNGIIALDQRVTKNESDIAAAKLDINDLEAMTGRVAGKREILKVSASDWLDEADTLADYCVPFGDTSYILNNPTLSGPDVKVYKNVGLVSYGFYVFSGLKIGDKIKVYDTAISPPVFKAREYTITSLPFSIPDCLVTTIGYVGNTLRRRMYRIPLNINEDGLMGGAISLETNYDGYFAIMFKAAKVSDTPSGKYILPLSDWAVVGSVVRKIIADENTVGLGSRGYEKRAVSVSGSSDVTRSEVASTVLTASEPVAAKIVLETYEGKVLDDSLSIGETYPIPILNQSTGDYVTQSDFEAAVGEITTRLAQLTEV